MLDERQYRDDQACDDQPAVPCPENQDADRTMLGAEHPMEAHKADSRAMFSRGQSDDAREGVTSFLEKRPAAFTDKVSAGLPDFLPGHEEPVFE